MTDDITKELAEIVEGFRWFADMGETVNRGFLTRVDAALELYAEPFMTSDPEPVITRVEVITDTGRDYVNWEKDNKITTSLQDEGRTLKVFVNKTTEEPEMPITKPEFYDELIYTRDKTLYNKAEEEVSKQWATALSGLIDELSPRGCFSLRGYEEAKPLTPERVVEYLRVLMKYREQLAADNELEACVEWLGDAPVVWDNDKEMHPGYHLRLARRPKPTLKSQALKDFETVRKHSDLLPEILDTIENALKSIPE
jgi:hypothetical protein